MSTFYVPTYVAAYVVYICSYAKDKSTIALRYATSILVKIVCPKWC